MYPRYLYLNGILLTVVPYNKGNTERLMLALRLILPQLQKEDTHLISICHDTACVLFNRYLCCPGVI